MHAGDSGQIAGRHVLVVDNTWVSGAKGQSAAMALKAAGARRVTVLCVGRWLSYRWPEHRGLIEAGAPAYDAQVCPVDVDTCQAAPVDPTGR